MARPSTNFRLLATKAYEKAVAEFIRQVELGEMAPTVLLNGIVTLGNHAGHATTDQQTAQLEAMLQAIVSPDIAPGDRHAMLEKFARWGEESPAKKLNSVPLTDQRDKDVSMDEEEDATASLRREGEGE